MGQSDHIANLVQWAGWGKAYARPRLSRPDWSAVEILIEAAQPRLLEDSKALRELLERSIDQLKSSDPFLCDLGAHRWLETDREESYSDWLAWILEQLSQASVILRVLGVQNPKFVATCAGQPCRVEREAGVKEGRPGSSGRVDLVIHFGEPEVAVLGVEVKTFDENYEKQRGYVQSLRKFCSHVECVLVANDDVPQNRLFGFNLQTWENLSVALRQVIAGYIQSHGANAISMMMLGFVGAIEQNLLGYGIAAPRRAWENRTALFPEDLSNHLRRALEVHT
jgi:hypothetical protein